MTARAPPDPQRLPREALVVGKRSLLALAAILLGGSLSGCWDPFAASRPPDSGLARPLPARAEMGLEQVYRMLYARLHECLPAGYHLKPRFDRQRRRAELLLVSGLGLHDLAILDTFEARFDIQERDTDGGRQAFASLIVEGEELRFLQRLLPLWLDGDTRCNA